MTQTPPTIPEFLHCSKLSGCRTALMISDKERELVIKDAAALVERHWAVWEATGCFAARGMADRARMSMEALIRGRSAAQVAKMEQERGLS